VLTGGEAVDKTKIKYGVARIVQSSFSFFTHTFLRLFGIVLALAAIVLFVELIGRNSQWLDRKLQLLTVGIIAVVTSISLTQWLLLVLVLIVWNNNIVGRRILDKLKAIESALGDRAPRR
jgi:hypothetical protein